jgi:excisionase family DNA binding protein
MMVGMTGHAVSEIQADAAEHGRVHAVLALVSGADQKVVVGVGSDQVELPPSLVEALLAAADSLDAGDSVSIMSQSAEVSPAQAAKLLGVSRQYVDRLVDNDVLPSRRLTNSSYRRIPVRAVLAHRAMSERKRAGITAIIDDAIASGLPY